MQITVHVDAIQRDLAAAASLGGDEVAEAGRRLADAVEPSLRLQLLDVLGQAALALNSQLGGGHVEVRLVGRDPDLVFVDAPPEPEEPPAPGDDLSARITLRLPEALKGQVEEAAAREGVSTNAWIVRALARALEQRPTASRRTGNRLQGYARG
jgi:HicB family